MATPVYVIHPARLQVWGGNCAISEVSLGSFLITSVASRQLSRPGHASPRRDRVPCRGSDGRGQRWHGAAGDRQPVAGGQEGALLGTARSAHAARRARGSQQLRRVPSEVGTLSPLTEMPARAGAVAARGGTEGGGCRAA